MTTEKKVFVALLIAGICAVTTIAYGASFIFAVSEEIWKASTIGQIPANAILALILIGTPLGIYGTRTMTKEEDFDIRHKANMQKLQKRDRVQMPR